MMQSLPGQVCLQELTESLVNFQNIRAQYLTVLHSEAKLQADFIDEFEQCIRKFSIDFSNIQWKVTQMTDTFKRDQQRSIISGILDLTILDWLEQCNTILLQFYLMVIEDVNKAMSHVSIEPNLSVKHKLINLLNELNNLMHLILQQAFVVVKQPCSSILKHDPLTIISNARFEAKLCLLFDHQLISNLQNKSMQMDVLLLKEEEIRAIFSDGLNSVMMQKPSFNIINKAEPGYGLENKKITISIACMLKVDINRRGHNPKALPVAEEKFKFVFCLKIDIMNREYILHTLSLPVNVLSRKDYRNSYATIIWDNAFPIEGRQMFEVHDIVSWSELAEVLNYKFHKDVGVYLCSEHLEFIYSMIPHKNEAQTVSWEQFAKQTLPMRQFTFFEWFYRVLILVREKLLKMYCDGLILGFISSETAERYLLNCVDGTFLIRFSETFCGAISIAYVKNRKFDKLFPWDLDRLRKISLAHTIKCSDFLLYLYPNIPKDDVFCKYYVHNETPRSITGKDYKSDANIAQVINQQDGTVYGFN